MLVVMGSRARRAIVLAPGGHRRPVEGIDLGAGFRREGDVRAAPGLASRADPEESLAVLAEAGVGVGARFLRRDLQL